MPDREDNFEIIKIPTFTEKTWIFDTSSHHALNVTHDPNMNVIFHEGEQLTSRGKISPESKLYPLMIASIFFAIIPAFILTLIIPLPSWQKPVDRCNLNITDCAKPTLYLDGEPSINAKKIYEILKSNKSPAASLDNAENMYSLGQNFHINPAYALAFFYYVSDYGVGEGASSLKSLGKLKGYDIHSLVFYTLDKYGYRKYNDWIDGIKDWYWFIETHYIQKGINDVASIYDNYPQMKKQVNENNLLNIIELVCNKWSN